MQIGEKVPENGPKLGVARADFALPAPPEGCIADFKQPCLLSSSWAVHAASSILKSNRLQC